VAVKAQTALIIVRLVRLVVLVAEVLTTVVLVVLEQLDKVMLERKVMVDTQFIMAVLAAVLQRLVVDMVRLAVLVLLGQEIIQFTLVAVVEVYGLVVDTLLAVLAAAAAAVRLVLQELLALHI
jgi:hypothetical protein